jgi:pilus assembly protein Flp/PilA
MLNQIMRFVKEEDGATAVEYGLMVALIAAVIVGSVTALGTKIKNKFNSVEASIANSGS